MTNHATSLDTCTVSVCYVNTSHTAISQFVCSCWRPMWLKCPAIKLLLILLHISSKSIRLHECRTWGDKCKLYMQWACAWTEVLCEICTVIKWSSASQHVESNHCWWRNCIITYPLSMLRNFGMMCSMWWLYTPLMSVLWWVWARGMSEHWF